MVIFFQNWAFFGEWGFFFENWAFFLEKKACFLLKMKHFSKWRFLYLLFSFSKKFRWFWYHVWFPRYCHVRVFVTRSRSILLVVAGIGYSSRLMINIERWQEEQDAEQRRKDAMKLGDEERETILQVMIDWWWLRWYMRIESLCLRLLLFPNGQVIQNHWCSESISNDIYVNEDGSRVYFCRPVQLFFWDPLQRCTPTIRLTCNFPMFLTRLYPIDVSKAFHQYFLK